MKRLLRSLLVLALSLNLSAFAQDKPDPAAQAKPVAADQKPEAAVSEQAQAEALQKATQNPIGLRKFNVVPKERAE